MNKIIIILLLLFQIGMIFAGDDFKRFTIDGKEFNVTSVQGNVCINEVSNNPKLNCLFYNGNNCLDGQEPLSDRIACCQRVLGEYDY